MSASVVQAVMASDLKPTGVRMVALCLAWHCNDDGLAWPGRAKLAREAGVTPDYAKKVLHGLERDRVIEVAVRGGSSDGRKWISRYRFTDHWLGVWRTRVLENRGSTEPTTGGLENPRPGVSRPPRKDERKASLSFSSKSAHPRNGNPPGVGVSVPVAAPKENSQKTLDKGNSPRLATVGPWNTTDAGIEAKGVELGVGRWDGKEPRKTYDVRVFKAAHKAGGVHSIVPRRAASATGAGHARP